MLNYSKIVVAVLAAVFIGMITVMGANAGDAGPININTASAGELTQLKGIGANQAARIIEFREKNGPFQKPEDLMRVPRIGPKTFEKNKDLILVEVPKKPASKNQMPKK
ncbi:MAG: helix-hairpin-helix domain-containing protein [Desulfobacterales bacterium]|jgi:competence protein ComEA